MMVGMNIQDAALAAFYDLKLRLQILQLGPPVCGRAHIMENAPYIGVVFS